MSQISAVLRKTEQGYLHWCPGCKHAHHVWVGNATGANWTFDGNVDAPTFSPSVRHFTPADSEDGMPEVTECHYFIRSGQIEFCGDCAHDLKGKVVPLPPFPTDYAS